MKLASLLFANNPGIKVEYFNFYEPGSYEVFDSVPSPVLVFTVHAVEQLPRSSILFDTLQGYRERIKTVFHFEPVYELHDETLLGLMRRCYAEKNDYNRNLISQLQSRPYIRVVHVKADIIGLNPLNPTSIINWVFEQDVQ